MVLFLQRFVGFSILALLLWGVVCLLPFFISPELKPIYPSNSNDLSSYENLLEQGCSPDACIDQWSRTFHQESKFSTLRTIFASTSEGHSDLHLLFKSAKDSEVSRTVYQLYHDLLPLVGENLTIVGYYLDTPGSKKFDLNWYFEQSRQLNMPRPLFDAAIRLNHKDDISVTSARGKLLSLYDTQQADITNEVYKNMKVIDFKEVKTDYLKLYTYLLSSFNEFQHTRDGYSWLDIESIDQTQKTEILIPLTFTSVERLDKIASGIDKKVSVQQLKTVVSDWLHAAFLRSDKYHNIYTLRFLHPKTQEIVFTIGD
ncbi:hypothetical protein [Neptuniibacter sp. QD37_11]|uniref:hypothetical protein n=1 Tax=Neptuniibacter sp. QD37_11 TaxID=3398209 RepID=UPI0039F6162E